MNSRFNENEVVKQHNKKININNFNFEKFKIRKIKCSNAEYKKKIDKILQNLLVDFYKSKSQKFKINKINYKLNNKKILKPTPFQIYEKIKSVKLNISRDKKFDKFYLTPNKKSSSVSTSTKHLQNSKTSKNFYRKENKFRFIAPKKKFFNKRINSFAKNIKLNDYSNDYADFSNWVIKNDIKKDKNNIKKNIGRNIKIKINNLKIKNEFHKQNNLSNDNISFYKIRNNNKMKNLPLINKSVSQQTIIKT